MRNKFNYILQSFFFIFFITVLLAGCAGARGHLKFEKLKYPVSMSAFIYGEEKNVLQQDKDLKILGPFHYEKTFWGMTYSFVKLSDSADIDESINKAIQEKNGDAMINLQVQVSGCAINSFQLIFGILPFWPGCTNAVIDGEVVKWIH